MSDSFVEPRGVAAVIVTYNRLDKLKTTVERTLSLPFTHVVVVNNASSDGTAEWLDSLTDARLHRIHEPENRGGAGGFARGFDEAARRTSAEWLVCFDDDAYPAANALAAFSKLSLSADVGGVAAAVYLPSGAISAMNRPGVNAFRSGKLLWQALRRRSNRFGVTDAAYQSAAPSDVSYSSFVGLFVRCDLVPGVLGLPRAELFIYGDDTLFTLGIERNGYRLLFAPAVRFVHDCETLQQQRRVYQPLWKAFYTFRNGIIFYRQLSGFYFYPIMLPILLISWMKPTLSYKRPLKFIAVAYLAISDGLRGDLTRTHDSILEICNANGKR